MRRQPKHELLQLVEAGTVKPIVDRTFPLNDAGTAHQYLAERRTTGKVLLIPWSCQIVMLSMKTIRLLVVQEGRILPNKR